MIETAIAEARWGDVFEQLQHALGRSIADRLCSGYSIPAIVNAIVGLGPLLRAVYTMSLVDGLYNRAFRGRWPSLDDPRPHFNQPDQPVVDISWYDAKKYSVGKRVPMPLDSTT